jgi:cytochrome c peroxidase
MHLVKQILILRSVTLWFLIASATLALIGFFPGAPTANASLQPKAIRVQIPTGIPRWKWRKLIPRENPLTAEKVALGQALYFDKRLSVDGTVSCATCHDPATAFADRNGVAMGVAGRIGTRNVPTTLNAMFNQSQFWDGRARSLEEQAMQPLLNPLEMGMPDREAVVTRLNAISEYRRSFAAAFGTGAIKFADVARAIASYERTLLSADSPFDRFMAGDTRAITEGQKRGWQLFRGKANCIACHAFTRESPFFTDNKFHNTGIIAADLNLEELLSGVRSRSLDGLDSKRLGELAHTEKLTELGRFLITRQKQDTGAFKTPTLRDIELTPPYMHNASEKTLLDVMRFYNEGGKKNQYLDEKIRPLNLSEKELSDLVEFMRTLTSDSVLRRAQQTSPQTRTPVVLPG